MKKHRVLGRVLEVKDKEFTLILPGWSNSEFVQLSKNIIPEDLASFIKPNQRFILWCNLAATCPIELYCERFELAPEPSPDDGLI